MLRRLHPPRLSAMFLCLIPWAAWGCSTLAEDGATDHEHTDGGHDGGSAGEGGAVGAAGAGGAGAGLMGCGDVGVCGLTECQAEDRGGAHVELCSTIAPHTNPPTSGPHYGYWAAFGIYQTPIPDGFLIHSLEHSAVALLYNCDLVEESGASCAELEAELLTFYEGFSQDPLCSDVPHRLIVAPSETLDVPFAATAWNHHLKGTCFDQARVEEFILAHYGKNYENICASGIDPEDAGCQ